MAHVLHSGLGRIAWLLIYVVPGPRWAKLAVLAGVTGILLLARGRRG